MVAPSQFSVTAQARCDVRREGWSRLTPASGSRGDLIGNNARIDSVDWRAMSEPADLISARAHGGHGPRIAAAPITWGVCEIPGWGEVPGVDHVLDEIAELGFTGTELGPDGYLPLDPGALRHALGSRGLSLVGAFCPLNYRDPSAFVASHDFGVALARRLAAVGCHTLVAADAGDARRSAIAGRVTGADGLSPDMWARYGEGLADLARAIAPLGVRVAFHPHAATYVETEAEIDAVMANTPADLVGLCLDTGHVAYGGGDPVALARRHAGRVWHVHVKDVLSLIHI